jgi:hypothetical protein
MNRTKTSLCLFIIALLFNACGEPENDPTPSTSSAAFTAKIGTLDLSTNDVTFLAFSSIGAIVKDTKGRSFTIAVFAKDFPLNKAISIAYTPSIAYTDENKVTYIAKSGTMTFSTLDNTKMVGEFNMIAVANTKELTITGKFNIVKK